MARNNSKNKKQTKSENKRQTKPDNTAKRSAQIMFAVFAVILILSMVLAAVSKF